MRRKTTWVACIAAVAIFVCATVLYVRNGKYGFGVVALRGGSIWKTVTGDDNSLPIGVRIALRNPTLIGMPGPFDWRMVGIGLETAELPVLVAGVEVDRILLTRIQPGLYRFVVRNDPWGLKDIDAWMAETGAVASINGSYFDFHGLPDTPFVIEGRSEGPKVYEAKHGAFVAGESDATIVDLARKDWGDELRGARNAMVSYPILIGGDGASRAGPSNWLANRSFVAVDGAGRVLLGTTRDAFFSLNRLAVFLKSAPLDLKLALNMDGGPLAGYAVASGGEYKSHSGLWELQTGDQISLLQPLIPGGRWGLPVVLTVHPK